MAARLLLSAFVGIAALLLPTSGATSDFCQTTCGCLGSMVDCSKRGLDEIPADIPKWVSILVLDNMNLKSIPDDTFKGLDRLEELDISNNQLTQINTSTFHHLPALKILKITYNLLTEMPVLGRKGNLTQLSLHHNRIEVINGGVLDSLPKLRNLDLNFNKISELSPEMFPPHPSLRQITINNNKIVVIKPGTFDNLTMLELLKLNKNKLQHLPKNIFSKMENLKYLELNKNRFHTIEGLTFKGLQRLTSLKLRRNGIHELMDGAFYGLPSIAVLQLDYNNITSVSKRWLYGLTSLQQLSLSHNHISEIETDSWVCEILWELDLTHNKVSQIDVTTFHSLPSLKYLYLDHNRVSYISDGAFMGLTTLQRLEMNYNHISWTVEDMNGAFEGLGSLNRLGLNSNRIKSIAKRSFNGLTELKKLHLVDNAISSVQADSFKPLISLEELHFNTSNLLCDCHLEWLPRWLRQVGFENQVDAKCAHPPILKGRSIFELKAEQLTCTGDIPKPIIIQDPESRAELRGSNVTLTCVARSSSGSVVSFQWKKDNLQLHNAEVVNTATTQDGDITEYTTALHLRDVASTDEGRYQCIVSNHLGATYSKKARITVHVFPSFTKTPDDVTVKAGTTARLECAATGHPQPVIAWQKLGGDDDFPAARERRMHVMPTDDVFFIVKVKLSDEGVYMCTATNDAGVIMANATVNVRERPSFLKAMEDKEVEEGQTSVLECMASGSPKPKLEWYKDSDRLLQTERHFYTANNQLLIIVQTRLSDAGHYTCEMSNTLGTKRGTSTLSVVALRPHDDALAGGLTADTTTTGIIIIAVVCCVVGTSLIWVIIIYHTRKRSEEYSSTPTDETTLPGEMPGTPYHCEKDGRSPGKHIPPPLATSFSKYPGFEYYGRDGPRMLAGKSRLAALFPSGLDEDDHRQSIPLTSDEHQLAEISDNSITALHRLQASSDSDTIHSSSPSTHSTRSTHSTGLLQTFHPHATIAAAPTLPPREGTAAVAVVHAMPAANSHSPRFANATDERSIPSSHHGSRPPDGPAGTDCVGMEGVYENVQALLDDQSATFPGQSSQPLYTHTQHNANQTAKDSSLPDRQSIRNSWSLQPEPPHELYVPPFSPGGTAQSLGSHHPVHTYHSKHRLSRHDSNADISLANQSEAKDEGSQVIPDSAAAGDLASPSDAKTASPPAKVVTPSDSDTAMLPVQVALPNNAAPMPPALAHRTVSSPGV